MIKITRFCFNKKNNLIPSATSYIRLGYELFQTRRPGLLQFQEPELRAMIPVGLGWSSELRLHCLSNQKLITFLTYKTVVLQIKDYSTSN